MISTNKDFIETITKERRKNKLIRSRAISLHCLDCMGYKRREVTLCSNHNCPLWEYRTGRYTPIGIDKQRKQTGV